jgi:hypothetical protein
MPSMRRASLIGLALVGCSLSELPPLRTAGAVRDELCAMAPMLPPSPELQKLQLACKLSRPLSEVAAAFEQCDGK